jgi:hypothetical protein
MRQCSTCHTKTDSNHGCPNIGIFSWSNLVLTHWRPLTQIRELLSYYKEEERLQKAQSSHALGLTSRNRFGRSNVVLVNKGSISRKLSAISRVTAGVAVAVRAIIGTPGAYSLSRPRWRYELHGGKVPFSESVHWQVHMRRIQLFGKCRSHDKRRRRLQVFCKEKGKIIHFGVISGRAHTRGNRGPTVIRSAPRQWQIG